MKIQDGMFYRIANGDVVRVQAEQGGFLAAYNAAGERVHHAEEKDHVNGWEPAGVVDWEAARKAHKESLAAEKEGRKTRRKKSAKKPKEESSEKDQGEDKT